MCFHIRESSIKLARQLVEAYRRLATPFFGPYCQGIRHALLIVQPTKRINFCPRKFLLFKKSLDVIIRFYSVVKSDVIIETNRDRQKNGISKELYI